MKFAMQILVIRHIEIDKGGSVIFMQIRVAEVYSFLFEYSTLNLAGGLYI